MWRDQVRHHRFTAEEYHELAEVGLLHEDARVELIGGRYWTFRPSAGPPRRRPLRRERAEPQPELALARADPNGMPLPGPEDVLLAVEVSGTTLAYDKNVKLPLYAGVGQSPHSVAVEGDMANVRRVARKSYGPNVLNTGWKRILTSGG